ncbi:hypothetical protein SDC9_131092 [bioreactor metagenome]|uniref:Uncharacterized protein n=1 Tax=bioreactor metagenome TaxID=1076179 RepID=A0A645D5V9_9ZZZZ
MPGRCQNGIAHGKGVATVQHAEVQPAVGVDIRVVCEHVNRVSHVVFVNRHRIRNRNRVVVHL